MTLIYLSTAWLIGIAAARWLHPPLPVVSLLTVPPLAALLLWRDAHKVRRIAACGLFLLLGSPRYTLFLPDLADPSHIAAYRDQGWVTLGGRVVGEPDVRDTHTNLCLAVDRVRIEDEEHRVKCAHPAGAGGITADGHPVERRVRHPGASGECVLHRRHHARGGRFWGSTKGKQGRSRVEFRVAILYKHEPAVAGSWKARSNTEQR